MTRRTTTIALGLLTITAYLARPWSCMAAIQLEVRPPDQPYHSIDPHGYGVLGAVLISLVLMGPVLWLLLQDRPPDVAAKASLGRTAAVMLAIATPMLLQLTYLKMPFAWCWPIVVVSAIWAMVVLASCLRAVPGSLSAQGAFDRHPRAAWTLVGAIGVGKAAVFALALV